MGRGKEGREIWRRLASIYKVQEEQRAEIQAPGKDKKELKSHKGSGGGVSDTVCSTS